MIANGVTYTVDIDNTNNIMDFDDLRATTTEVRCDDPDTLNLSFDTLPNLNYVVVNNPNLLTFACRNCPKLVKVDLSNCYTLETVTIHNVPSLTLLNVDKCHHLSRLSLANTKLRWLDLTSQVNLRNLSCEVCSRLRSIQHNGIEQIRLSGVPEVNVIRSDPSDEFINLVLPNDFIDE